MKKLLLLIITLAFCLPSVAEETPSLLAITPSQVAFAAHVADTPDVIASWPESPFAKLWADPEVVAFFAPLREDMEVELWNEQVVEETGYEIDEILAFFAGEAILYIPAEEKLFADLDENDEFPLVLIAEVGERAEELSNLLVRQEEKEDRETEAEDPLVRELRDFRGVELHIDKEPTDDGFSEEFTWAVFDGLFVLATTPDLVEKMVVDTQEGGAEESLADNEEFRSVQRRVGAYDLLWYGDFNFLQAELRDELIREQETDPAPELATTQAIFDALGLDNLGAGFAAMLIENDAIDVIGGITFSENQGLIAVLAYPSDPISQARWVPANATTFGVSHFDFEASWAAIETIIDAFNPAFRAMAIAQMTAMTENAGVQLDLRNDVLANLGEDIIVVQTPVAAMSAESETGIPTPSQVVAIEIVERESFEMAIESLKTMAGQGSELFETRDYLGTTIFTAKMDSPENPEAATEQQGFSYAITNNHFLLGIGDASTLEAVLVSMQKPGKSAWDRAEVKSALASLPPGADAIEYQDLTVSILTALNTIAVLGGVAADDEAWVVPEAIPSKDTISKYVSTGVSAAYKDDNSLTLRMRILQPEHSAISNDDDQ